MPDDTLTLLISPGPSGNAWRAAIAARAVQMGWPVADVGPEGPPEGAAGLFFARHHTALALSSGHRAVITDTTAVATADPSQPATSEDLIARSNNLVEADLAVRQGAKTFNAARYQLTLPGIGLVERGEGQPYRIHPLAASSPLALFEELPVVAGVETVWASHWFTYGTGRSADSGSPWIDLTGRMRPLVYGPYVWLPAGRWRVDVRVAVDPEKAHVPLLFEWGSGGEFCRVMTEVRHSGVYSVSLDRIWVEADAAQLRIWNAHPVFQGRLSFEECRIVRVRDDDPRPLTPVDRVVTANVI